MSDNMLSAYKRALDERSQLASTVQSLSNQLYVMEKKYEDLRIFALAAVTKAGGTITFTEEEIIKVDPVNQDVRLNSDFAADLTYQVVSRTPPEAGRLQELPIR
jgi:hypothetical protein